MIYNDENIEMGKIEVNYGYWITIKSKDNKKELVLNFKPNVCDFKDMNINQSIDLINYLHWDTTLKTDEIYYLFDLSKEKVVLTKLEYNVYKLDINIENPDMIYSPLGENATFKNLIINVEFSFNYDYKPKKDDSILKRSTHKSNVSLMDVLNRI